MYTRRAPCKYLFGGQPGLFMQPEKTRERAISDGLELGCTERKTQKYRSTGSTVRPRALELCFCFSATLWRQ